MENCKPSITSFLDKRSKKKGELYPVKVTVYFAGYKKRYRTGIDFTIDEYEKLNQPNLRDDNLKIKRRKLEAYLAKVATTINGLELFSFDAFEDVYFQKRIVRRSSVLADRVQSYIDQLEENEQIGTAISYRSTMNSFLVFRKGARLSDVTTDFLKEYERYMRLRGSSPTTIGIYLRQLRRIINVAINDGLLPAGKYPFKGYCIPASRNIKKALNENQVIALLNYQTGDLDKRKALDFWLFSYVSNGINMADICLLTRDKFQKDFFHYFRAKTKNTKKKDLRPIKVPLMDLSRNVIKEWGNPNKCSTYVFPILHGRLTAKQIKYKIQDFIAFVNKHMKLIAADVGIEGNIGTYVARHTHCTILKRQGVATEFIKENLGHSSVMTTESYLGDFEDDVKMKYATLLTNF